MTMATEPTGLAGQLALRLLEHIRRSNLAVGAHVTEQQIADAFNVSRSPVRRALAMLAAKGFLEFERNRGYFVKRIPGRTVIAGLREPTSAAEERYLRIADDRLAGRLADHVTESALMARYEIPRRELQRILQRMENEGWIERKPGHGWMFSALANSVEAHAQSYRFRMLFEPAALLEPGFRLDTAELARVRADQQMLLDGGVHRVSRSRLFEMGSDFHETLMGFSQNRFIVDAIRRVNASRRLLEYRAHFDRERFRGQCREHLYLLDLLEQGSREDAARFLRKHLDVVRAIKTEPRNAAAAARIAVAAHL